MEVVFSLVGVSVILLVIVALALLWSLRGGQFDDLEGPAWRVLMDDDTTVRQPADKPDSQCVSPRDEC